MKQPSPIITFPHAGDYSIAFEHFFLKLGYEVLVPPKSSKASLDLGIKYSPAQACLPFKATLGNLIQGLEQGANVVVMIGGKTGMCRLAYYSQMYKKILTELGYAFELFNFKIKKEMWDTAKRHFPATRFRDFAVFAYEFWLKIKLIELIREEGLKVRPFEKTKGETSLACREMLEELVKIPNVDALKKHAKLILNRFNSIEKTKNTSSIKIGLVGEFFLLIDQFSTFNLESSLGDLGVAVEASLGFSDFFVGSINFVRFLDNYLPTSRHKVMRLAEPFINRAIGGHAMQSIGQTIRYQEQGFDGVIHLYPLSCMPEVSAASILPKVSERLNFPVMSICFDEQTGFAGIETRLEAFVDMLKRKKQNSAYALP